MFAHTRTAAALFAALALLLCAAPASALSIAGLFGSPVDKELVAQVPQDKRGEINAADFEFAVANEELALAKLKEELAGKQDDQAGQSTKLAKAQARAAEIALDLARIQAVIAARLGKPEDNAKILADLTAERTKNEAERIQLKAKVDQAAIYVRDAQQRVADKEKIVSEFKARRSPAPTVTAPAAPAVAPKPAPAPAPVPASPVVDEKVVQEPAPLAPPPLGPEADLKN